jgi:ABC-type spermidine/putrescine transport system permease subunit I
MSRKLLSRESINVVLVYAMGVFLTLAFIGGVISLFVGKQVVGSDISTAADASGWLYAAAFLSMFGLTLSDQKKTGGGHRLH